MSIVEIIVALTQGVAAIVLAVITWRYVLLTKQIVDFQIEPRIEFDIPSDILEKPIKLIRIVNYSRCAIENISFYACVSYRNVDGTPTPIMKCIDTRNWDVNLKHKGYIEFDISSYYSITTELSAEYEIPSHMRLARGLVHFSISYRRSADGKEYCFQESYSAIADADGTVKVSKCGKRQQLESLDRMILRKVVKDVE
jgi:hypothetical protein